MTTNRKEIATVVKEIRWVQRNIHLERWTPDDFHRKYWRRTPEQVVQSGETNFLGPCMDLTIVMLDRLKKKGYNPELLVQELINEHSLQPSLHFAIEVPINGKIHTIDFYAQKRAVFYEGNFNPRRTHTTPFHLNVQRFPSDGFTSHTTPYKFLKVSTRREANRLFTHVKPIHLRALYRYMESANTPANFGRIRSIPSTIRRQRLSRKSPGT